MVMIGTVVEKHYVATMCNGWCQFIENIMVCLGGTKRLSTMQG